MTKLCSGKPLFQSSTHTVSTKEWKISFTPIKIGLFNVLMSEERYQVNDSLHFQVEPGNMYPSVCVASWKGVRHEYEAGSKAAIIVLLKDAFGNSISNTIQVSYLPDFNKFIVSLSIINNKLCHCTHSSSHTSTKHLSSNFNQFITSQYSSPPQSDQLPPFPYSHHILLIQLDFGESLPLTVVPRGPLC
ncbi:hypothetical protein VNO78_12245 [Psophocarpus tetragonolobus]|uniref:GEX2 N-terminal Ig-like domain-containing protein n=1 Tax=Psophocarpus tetragonolobus TaxID=3891 RepID=A0AAN9SNL0_PSOTE